MVKKILLAIAALTAGVTAQTYRRTGACPNFGCLFPPDQADFIAGQVFDIRIEIQAPFNGSEAYGGGVVNPNFSLTIEGGDGKAVEISDFYSVKQPAVDSYNFTYFEDLFARDNNSATLVNVLAQTYRHVTLYTPGTYTVVLNYNGGSKTVATWIVRPLSEATAKNVILFIGDGMTTAMVTAARLLGHKSINGKYQTKMALDGAPAFGMQTTHSLDSFITDSANSATALYAGKKSTVNALNVYTDSTGKPTGNPKFETVFEMFRRITGGMVGIVSTAYLADATPAAVLAHTSQRSASDIIVDQYLDGVTSAYPWTQWDGPDVLFGGGGSDFLPKNSNKNVSKLAKFQARGYDFVSDNTTLSKLGNTKRALGLFGKTTLPTWLDRNVYKQNLANFDSYNGTKGVYDTPGLKDMTLKAIDILASRSSTAGTGFMLMSEAASIDKAMHAADYERALGDLLELDQTVAATLQHLKDLGIYEETLVIVTADHGHGFDVFGGSDSAYMRNAKNDTQRRDSIGLYQSSGLSQYQVAPGSSAQNNTPVVGPQGPGFPNQWQPRYTAAFGMSSVVDHYENFITPNSSRLMSQLAPNSTTVYVANPTDSAGVGGFYIGGNLPVTSESGVHSLTDVPVYAWSAGCEAFRGVMNSPDIAFHIADALGLGRDYNATGAGAGKGNGKGNGNGNGNGKGKDILSSLPVRLPTI